MKLSRFSVRHPVVIGMILIALAFFGIFAIFTTNVEFVSEINMPQVYVVSVWPGASSEDIEKEVIDILEDDFVTLSDFRSVSSQRLGKPSRQRLLLSWCRLQCTLE